MHGGPQVSRDSAGPGAMAVAREEASDEQGSRLAVGTGKKVTGSRSVGVQSGRRFTSEVAMRVRDRPATGLPLSACGDVLLMTYGPYRQWNAGVPVFIFSQ